MFCGSFCMMSRWGVRTAFRGVGTHGGGAPAGVPLAARVVGPSGARQEVVVLHGLLGAGQNWLTIARQLVDRVAGTRVHLLDARNHGQSPWHDDNSLAAQVADVMQYVDGLRRATPADDISDGDPVPVVRLIGHSMGGKTAMLCALRQPATFDRLAVVDIAPSCYGPSHMIAGIVDAMEAMDLSAVPNLATADRLLSVDIPDRQVRSFALTSLQKVGGAGWTRASGQSGAIAQTDRQQGEGPVFRWRSNLSAIRKWLPEVRGWPGDCRPLTGETPPSLFVRGALSNYVTDETHVPDIERFFPGHQLVTVPNAGHWVHAENPPGFIDAVVPFLRAK